jgi:hypothetical protein
MLKLQPTRTFKRLSFSITVGVFLLTGTLTPVVMAGPELKIIRPTINFGRVTQNKLVTTDFFIKSIGDEPLKITVLWPGCGCTEIPLPDSTVMPGDSVQLRVKFSTGRMQGPVIKAPSVTTTASPDLIKLSIMAEVIMKPEDAFPVVLLPEVADISQYGGKVRRMDKFTLENKGDQDLKVSVVDSALKSFEVKVPELLPAGATIEGRLRVIDTMVVKDFEESVTFLLKGKEEFLYTLPVVRRYRPTGLPGQ